MSEKNSIENEFRIIKPHRYFDNRRESDAFIIPCIVREITQNSVNNKREIFIDIINFKNGNLDTIRAITYEKSLLVTENISTPFKSSCKVIKNNFTNNFDFIVHGLYNTDDLLNDINEVNINVTEVEALEIFENNYKELNDWFK